MGQVHSRAVSARSAEAAPSWCTGVSGREGKKEMSKGFKKRKAATRKPSTKKMKVEKTLIFLVGGGRENASLSVLPCFTWAMRLCSSVQPPPPVRTFARAVHRDDMGIRDCRINACLHHADGGSPVPCLHALQPGRCRADGSRLSRISVPSPGRSPEIPSASGISRDSRGRFVCIPNSRSTPAFPGNPRAEFLRMLILCCQGLVPVS